MRRSPLGEAQARAGAAWREEDGCVVTAHYGDARGEYEAVRGGRGAGLFDLSARGRVEVSGAEAVRFLVSDKARYLTGTEFVIDGGLLAGVPHKTF